MCLYYFIMLSVFLPSLPCMHTQVDQHDWLKRARNVSLPFLYDESQAQSCHTCTWHWCSSWVHDMCSLEHERITGHSHLHKPADTSTVQVASSRFLSGLITECGVGFLQLCLTCGWWKPYPAIGSRRLWILLGGIRSMVPNGSCV